MKISQEVAMAYTCSLCQETVKGDTLVYIEHTEQHIIDEIRSSHPEWAEEDGLCRKCVDYFKAQLRGRDERF